MNERAFAPGQWGTLERLSDTCVRDACETCACLDDDSAVEGHVLLDAEPQNEPRIVCEGCEFLGTRDGWDVYVHHAQYFATWTAVRGEDSLVDRFSLDALIARIDGDEMIAQFHRGV